MKFTKSNLKLNLLGAVYAILNCLPPAPILLLNLIPLLYTSSFKRGPAFRFTSAITFAAAMFIPFHISSSIEVKSYAISYSLLVFVIFTSIAGASLAVHNAKLNKLATVLTNWLAFVFVISTLLTFFTGDPTLVGSWYEHYYSSGVVAKRYNGFMYEASHYALMVAPVLFYWLAYWNFSLSTIIKVSALLTALSATLSIGFFAILAATIATTMIFEALTKQISAKILLIPLVAVIATVTLYVSNEAVRNRLANVIAGEDSSTRGRAVESYHLAINIAELNSAATGVGPGQIKVLGTPLINDFYNYSIDTEVGRIPSSAAETLASYGLIGLLLKVIILVYLYLSRRIYLHRYANLIFSFFFIYQFFGSFMLSTIEIFCFSFATFLASKKQNH